MTTRLDCPLRLNTVEKRWTVSTLAKIETSKKKKRSLSTIETFLILCDKLQTKTLSFCLGLHLTLVTPSPLQPCKSLTISLAPELSNRLTEKAAGFQIKYLDTNRRTFCTTWSGVTEADRTQNPRPVPKNQVSHWVKNKWVNKHKRAPALDECGTATKVNYLKEGLIYSRARHTLNPVQTGLRLQYPTCWSTLARRQIQIGLPYLPCQAGTEVGGISSPLRLFPAGSTDELIKVMISRKMQEP